MRIAVLAALGGLLFAAPASAQFNSTGGGTQSSFGSRNLGGSLSAGSRTLGRGSGQNVAGATQQGGDAGQITGNERFLRQNRQGQFVGSDSSDAANIFSALSGAGARANNTGLRGNNRNQNPNSGNNQQSGTRYFPTRRVVGFNFSVPTAAISEQLGQRFDRLPGITNLGEIEVAIQGRVAILRGTVATEHDRATAGRVALLEAGISAVQNELQVAESLPQQPDSEEPPEGPREF